LRRILTEPKNALIRQYIKLFAMDGIELKFDADALDLIVDHAVERKLGARGLRGMCEIILRNAMFDLPGSETTTLRVTADYAKAQIQAQHEHFDEEGSSKVPAKTPSTNPGAKAS
jgi:ATP-dependent Clp protease ATP-binding subunit ClpX